MMRLVLATACLAGVVFAQQPPPGAAGPRGGFGRGPGAGMRGPMSERRLTAQLNLTAEQQNKIQTVLDESRVQEQGMNQKAADLQTQLAAAVRAGDESKIDQISQDISTVRQQRTAIEAKAMAKIYATLTPDQRTKFDPMLNRALGMRTGRGGPGARPRPGGRQQPNAPPQQ